MQNSFLEEYKALQKIRDPLDQLHVPRLSGLVEAEDDIVGILMNYIETDQPDLSYV